MKKLLLPIAILAMVSVSCKKDTECTCETIIGGVVVDSEVVDPAAEGVDRCKDLDFDMFGTGYKCK